MPYKNLILDFDGTLADTQNSILETMKLVGSHFNIRNVDESHIKNLIGLPLKTTFEKALGLDETLLAEATHFYRSHYNQVAYETIDLFEGVKETLTMLHQQGIGLTVASSKGRESLVKILQKHQLDQLFAFIGGEEDANHKKPAPDIVNLIVNKFGWAREGCLVVGDTIFDIEMGQRAGVPTCGVTYGNNSYEQLKSQNPSHIIDTFTELHSVLRA